MRTTIDIDAVLLKRLRDEAHRRGIPFKQMLAATLQRGLDARGEARRRYRCPTHSLGGPSEVGALDKALRVAEELHDEKRGYAPKSRR